MHIVDYWQKIARIRINRVIARHLSYQCVMIMIYIMVITNNSFAATLFGESLCHTDDYQCVTIQRGDTWDNLFPNEEQRDIVRRINRMNIALKPGMHIAVPKQLEQLSIYDVAPFPRYIAQSDEKLILVSQKQLAFAAYDEHGELIWWGPISSGINKCASPDGNCLTPTGAFRIIRKQDIDCISTVFPIRADGDNGGAVMPYCMHFFRGFALHGSDDVPGRRASHGCVRLFIEDARWLNEEFIQLPGGEFQGTRVIIDSVS